MLQLTQQLKSGEMSISEVPQPRLSKGNILVRNYFSLISAGTEGSKVSTARKSYFGKAKEKPEQVKLVLASLKQEGIKSTYKKVMNKLDALSPLGYSSAGIVINVGENVKSLRVGDYVACGGADLANHAEIVSIPENLAVKVPDGVALEHAAFTTVASIALQGVRQADLKLGESCVVIGLGLLGQLTIQMLQASGVKVIGIDINTATFELAEKSGADLVFQRGDGQEENAILQHTGGFGSDAAIITAATSSLDPIEFAGRILRRKGRVIVVGSVPTGFSRENYYKKELEVRMATSYGPGRYDPKYEQKGYDYPIAYVRWTENRNMQAILEMVAKGRINYDLLTSHIFDFSDAPKAYQMIMDRNETFVGILLKYNIDEKIRVDVKLESNYPKVKDSDLNISFIGAGSFAQNSLLPNISNANLISVSTSQGHSALNVASKRMFFRATTDSLSIINETESNILFIATRHDDHGELVIKGLEAGKHLFVEKPLCMTRSELDKISKIYNSQKTANTNYHHLMVGYNRRFSPHIQKIKAQLKYDMPLAINYRINAGYIPPEHWIQDKEFGGGRIIGEVCHFIDLCMFLAGSTPCSLYATQMPDALNLMDTINVSLQFINGTIANISYFSNGAKALNKEYLEVSSNGVTFVIDDFKTLYILASSKKKTSLMNQNKGHKREVESFLESIRNGSPTPIPFNEIFLTSQMTFDVIDSILQRKMILYS